MATQFTEYRSTDASAPTLSGTAGDLTTLLDAILVNGYGAKAAAGWTIDQTAANKRVYKQGSGSGVGYRIRDNAGGTGGAKEAPIRGSETWTDIDTANAGPFPTAAQSALTDDSQIIRKSSTADATTHVWKCYADSKTCYLFIQSGDTANTYYSVCFGDGYSLVPADPYSALLIARSLENVGTVSYEVLCQTSVTTAAVAVQPGHYFDRNYAGTGGSTTFGKTCASSISKNTAGANAWHGTLLYPHGPDGGLYLSRVLTVDITTGGVITIRGWLRGIWAPGHAPTNFADGDTVTGTGALAGRTFVCVKSTTATGDATCAFIETSNTVE